MRLGTWGGERRRRKGGLQARIEARFAVWGQAARGGGDLVLTSGSLGVKEPAFLGVGKNGQILIFNVSPTSSARLPQERARHGAALNIKPFCRALQPNAGAVS